ncbi:MAG: GNAT family N-acetyltransferase [Parvularculaceae bacterium]|nr:GNAT family N-acetyltransferase [Parvularculaceae bacterium]
MKFSLIQPQSVDDAFRAAWRRLEKRAAHPANPFFSSWFLEPALRLAEPGAVRLLAAQDDAGELVSLAAVERSETYAKLPVRHFAFWRHRHAYNSAPLIAEGRSEAYHDGLCAWIDTRPEGARFLRFNEHPVPPGSPLSRAPEDRAVVVDRRWRRACLAGGEEFEAAYARGYDGKKRKELRRQWKRLGEQGALRFVRWTEPADVAAAAEAFLALEQRGWKGRDEDGTPLAATPSEAAFFRAAMTAGAADGAVVVDAALLDGAPVAMLFSLRAGRTLSAYKIAFDETFAAYSPGVQLLVEAMRLMLADPAIGLFDSCAREGHPVVDSLWRDRLELAQINISSSRRVDRALLRTGAMLAAVNGKLTERRTIGRLKGGQP